MNLEQYRRAQKWTYEQLAKAVGLPDGGSAARIARGERWPGPARLQRIREATGGRVTLEAMLEARIAHMAEALNSEAGAE